MSTHHRQMVLLGVKVKMPSSIHKVHEVPAAFLPLHTSLLSLPQSFPHRHCVLLTYNLSVSIFLFLFFFRDQFQRMVFKDFSTVLQFRNITFWLFKCLFLLLLLIFKQVNVDEKTFIANSSRCEANRDHFIHLSSGQLMASWYRWLRSLTIEI